MPILNSKHWKCSDWKIKDEKFCFVCCPSGFGIGYIANKSRQYYSFTNKTRSNPVVRLLYYSLWISQYNAIPTKTKQSIYNWIKIQPYCGKKRIIPNWRRQNKQTSKRKHCGIDGAECKAVYTSTIEKNAGRYKFSFEFYIKIA